MKLIKALVTGPNEHKIKLELFLNDIKFEKVQENHSNGEMYSKKYSITIPDNKNNRIIVVETPTCYIRVLYENEVLSNFKYYKKCFLTGSRPNMLIYYPEKIFKMKIYADDNELSTFSFDDMESADFLFNFNISTGLADAIKEYYEEIKWLFSEYGSRKYLS